MLASGEQLLACGIGILMLVTLNATKYVPVIMTDVTARLNLEEFHQQ